MNTLRTILAELNGSALDARRAASRAAAKTNPNNPYLRINQARLQIQAEVAA